MSSSDSDDDISLGVLQILLRNNYFITDIEYDETMISDYDSDKDSVFQIRICKVRRYKGKVKAVCNIVRFLFVGKTLLNNYHLSLAREKKSKDKRKPMQRLK